MTAIGGESLDDSANPLAGPAWLWLMTTLGTWLVLGAGKWCERSTGEMVKRRFGMLVLGLVFGAIAFATQPVPDGRAARRLRRRQRRRQRAVARACTTSSGAPQLPAFLAYFGAVFLTDRLVEAMRSAPLVAAADRLDPDDDPGRLALAARCGRSRSRGASCSSARSRSPRSFPPPGSARPSGPRRSLGDSNCWRSDDTTDGEQDVSLAISSTRHRLFHDHFA